MKVLGDYFALQRGNTYKSALLGRPGPVLLGLGSIARNGGFKGSNLKTYGGPSDPRVLLEPGDIYVSLKDVTQSADLLGAVARVPSHIQQGRLTQDTVKLVFKTANSPIDYLYWLLQTPDYRAYCKAHSTGTTNLGLARDDFLAFPVPELTPIRQWIVDIVRMVEDKIELNRRMNETLEAMAQAIFRDWFIDFGPVRRRLAGETDPVAIMGGLTPDPARAAELAALFPAAFAEDGLPEGWEDVALSAHLDIVGGGTPKTSVASYWGGPIPWFSVVDTPTGSDTFVFATEKTITEAGLTGSSARLVPAGTTIISARGTVGNLAVAAQDMTFNQSCYALRSMRGDHPYFVYRAAAHAVDRLRAMAHGSVFSTITRQTFDSLTFPRAPLPLVDAFEAAVEPLFGRVRASVAESRTLADTRDYLLPRLMSGAVRVGEALLMDAVA